MDEIHKQITMLYMNYLMQRVLESGVKKEESIQKAVDIFKDDFSLFANYLKEKGLVSE